MLSGSSYIPPFYFYQFADAISAPYTSLKAYQSGIIDANGNILKPESSLDPFEYLVIKLKQIFEQLPYGMTKAKLGGYLSTLQLFAEEAEEYNFNSEYIHALIEGHIFQMTNGEVSYLELCEDMGVGGGGAGSLGTPMPGSGDNVGVAGFDPPLSDKILKRKYLQNCEIFEVCPEEYATFKNAKNWKNIPEGPTKNYLQRFQRRNKDAKIAVRTTLPESGEQDLYWITYPAKSFMEEFNLYNLNILNEGFIAEASNRISPKDVHQKFKEHLISQGYSEQKFPDIKVRKNSEELKKYHESLPAKSFYVSDDPNAPHGSDAFVKIESGEHSGIELKRSYPSRERNKKPSHHGMSGISVKSPLLDYAARIYGKMKELASKPSSLKQAFTGAAPQNGEAYSERYIGKVIEQGSQKAIEQKGDLIIGGHPEGVHVLSSSRKNNNLLFNKHAKIASAIGFTLTGNIRDWGGTLQTGYKASRPTKENDPGLALKTRVEVSPVPEDHEMYKHYINNAKFLN